MTAGRVGVALLLLLVGACSSDPGGAPATESTPSPTATAATSVKDQPAIDIPSLPLGERAKTVYLVDGVLHWRGRDIRTDLPADLALTQILGVVDGRVVLYGYQEKKGARPYGYRFFAVDRSGHAQQLAGAYEWYDYAPELVESTGHLWVQFTDRTTPRSIWEIDVRTARQIGEWHRDAVPQGLSSADRYVVDAFVHRRTTLRPAGTLTRDGKRRVSTKAFYRDTGAYDEAVIVWNRTDGTRLATFVFDSGPDGYVNDVFFEDRNHVLALIDFSGRRHPRYAVVRCSVAEQTCERVTAVVERAALGFHRPRFALRNNV